MAIIPTQSDLIAEDSAYLLPVYAKAIQYDECRFFGVRDDAIFSEEDRCRDIWTKPQRDNVLYYLAEAQQEIEQELNYLLLPRYIVGLLSEEPHGNDRFVDQQKHLPVKQLTRWGKIIEFGIRAETNLGDDVAVSHLADPAVIGPLAAVGITDVNEIHVYYPDTDVEIHPSSITLAGGNATIYVPRCRMVAADMVDNPIDGLDYADTSNFQATVDIRRVYTDVSQQAIIVRPHTCNATCASTVCSEQTQAGCVYVNDSIVGDITVSPATYSGGSWIPSVSLCPPGSVVRLYYLSGTQTLTRQAADAIVRLAHSKMPTEPCGCEVAQRLWRRDRNIPEVLTRERINCPFGLNDGAWIAWKFTQSLKEYRVDVL